MHCWPRVRNILCFGHKSNCFVGLVYFYTFYEMLNAILWWYRGISGLTQIYNIRHSNSPVFCRARILTESLDFIHKCIVYTLGGAICDHNHDDVIKWKHFPRYWLFVREIHRSLVNSPRKGQWRGALMFTLICARIKGWVNNGAAGDLRRNRAHYGVTVMSVCSYVYYISFKLQ